jgi:hypothetical protein
VLDALLSAMACPSGEPLLVLARVPLLPPPLILHRPTRRPAALHPIVFPIPLLVSSALSPSFLSPLPSGPSASPTASSAAGVPDIYCTDGWREGAYLRSG